MNERRIDFDEGGVIAVRSTHYPDYLRGEGLDLAILDEAAYMEPRVWPEVIRPMLTTTRGEAVFLSTPFGRNWFYDLWIQGVDPEWQPEWQSFWFPTERNPLIAREELESIKRETPEHIWRAEYGAVFTDDSGQVFRGIEAAVDREGAPERHSEHVYVAGVDWGRHHDYTAIAVIDATERRMVALERFSQMGFSVQRKGLMAVCEIWRPQQIWAEANSFGAPNIEALQEEGLPVRAFTTSSQSKSPLIESLALAIERRHIKLLDDRVLLRELAGFGLERLPGGGYRYGARAGQHDDTVIATALAWHGAERSGPRYGFV